MLLALVGFARPAWSQCQLDKLTPAGGAGLENIGRTVALSGEVALIGAPLAGEGGFERGVVYVYELFGAQWLQTARLAASDASDFDRFGEVVAVDGDVAVVGAQFADAPDFDSGQVYVFERAGPGSPFVETARLTASDAFIGDFFGVSVSVSVERIVIGACQAEGFEIFGIGKGKAYVFEKLAGVWTQQQIVNASDGAVGDQFGSAVALSGSRLLVGAEVAKVSGVTSGAAYVFELQGSSWVESAKVTPSDGAALDMFGRAAALDGATALIGSAQHSHGGVEQSGAAYVFELEAGSWNEKAELLSTGS
jgi:hypothetical protein